MVFRCQSYEDVLHSFSEDDSRGEWAFALWAAATAIRCVNSFEMNRSQDLGTLWKLKPKKSCKWGVKTIAFWNRQIRSNVAPFAAGGSRASLSACIWNSEGFAFVLGRTLRGMRGAFVLPDLRLVPASHGFALPPIHIWRLQEWQFSFRSWLRRGNFVQEVGKDGSLR